MMNAIYRILRRDRLFIDNDARLQIKKREIPSTQSPFTPLQIREKTVCLPSGIDSYDIQRVSRHRLRILDKLGEGNFGLVRV